MTKRVLFPSGCSFGQVLLFLEVIPTASCLALSIPLYIITLSFHWNDKITFANETYSVMSLLTLINTKAKIY
jgi:hypothetical protein